MATIKPARRIGGAVRCLHPANVISLALALVLATGGGAAAATGGSFILGKTNTETTTATLSNTKGTQLKLSAPFGTPPLTVNKTDTIIKNLDAQYADGYTGQQMANIGGDGYTQLGADTPIDTSGELVASTGPLPAGTYYVTATALLTVAAGDVGGFCYIVKGSNPRSPISEGGDEVEGFTQAAETAPVAVTADDTIQEWCQTAASNGSFASDAGITAIAVAFPEGDPPARKGTSIKALPGLPQPTR